MQAASGVEVVLPWNAAAIGSALRLLCAAFLQLGPGVGQQIALAEFAA